MSRHKHYDCILAWASGEKIEYFSYGVWDDWCESVGWHDAYEYRIKKEPVIEVKYFVKDDAYNTHNYVETYAQEGDGYYDLKITYQDGKAIKAEVAE